MNGPELVQNENMEYKEDGAGQFVDRPSTAIRSAYGRIMPINSPYVNGSATVVRFRRMVCEVRRCGCTHDHGVGDVTVIG